MEVKKTQQRMQQQIKKLTAARQKSAANLLVILKLRFKKISWTSREELKVYTKIVVGATFVFGMGIYVHGFSYSSSFECIRIVIRISSVDNR